MNKYFISTKKNPNLFVLKTKVFKYMKYRYKTTFFTEKTVQREQSRPRKHEPWTVNLEHGDHKVSVCLSSEPWQQDSKVPRGQQACCLQWSTTKETPCSKQD